MSTTRTDLNNLMRRRLNDHVTPYTWSNIQINQWINDAISDYAQHFARANVTGQTINCVADQREYSLSSFTGIQSLTRVEYPAGDDPPTLLTHRNTTDPQGFYGGAFYDTLGNPPVTLIIGESPSAGETIEIDYIAEHDYLDDDTDVCTVPDGHLEILVAFVRWAAAQERVANESQNPDSTTLILNTLSLEAFRAERAYRQLINRYQRQNSQDATIQWDLTDRWRNSEWA